MKYSTRLSMNLQQNYICTYLNILLYINILLYNRNYCFPLFLHFCNDKNKVQNQMLWNKWMLYIYLHTKNMYMYKCVCIYVRKYKIGRVEFSE